MLDEESDTSSISSFLFHSSSKTFEPSSSFETSQEGDSSIDTDVDIENTQQPPIQNISNACSLGRLPEEATYPRRCLDQMYKCMPHDDKTSVLFLSSTDEIELVLNKEFWKFLSILVTEMFASQDDMDDDSCTNKTHVLYYPIRREFRDQFQYWLFHMQSLWQTWQAKKETITFPCLMGSSSMVNTKITQRTMLNILTTFYYSGQSPVYNVYDDENKPIFVDSIKRNLTLVEDSSSKTRLLCLVEFMALLDFLNTPTNLMIVMQHIMMHIMSLQACNDSYFPFREITPENSAILKWLPAKYLRTLEDKTMCNIKEVTINQYIVPNWSLGEQSVEASVQDDLTKLLVAITPKQNQVSNTKDRPWEIFTRLVLHYQNSRVPEHMDLCAMRYMYDMIIRFPNIREVITPITSFKNKHVLFKTICSQVGNRYNEDSSMEPTDDSIAGGKRWSIKRSELTCHQWLQLYFLNHGVGCCKIGKGVDFRLDIDQVNWIANPRFAMPFIYLPDEQYSLRLVIAMLRYMWIELDNWPLEVNSLVCTQSTKQEWLLSFRDNMQWDLHNGIETSVDELFGKLCRWRRADSSIKNKNNKRLRQPEIRYGKEFQVPNLKENVYFPKTYRKKSRLDLEDNKIIWGDGECFFDETIKENWCATEWPSIQQPIRIVFSTPPKDWSQYYGICPSSNVFMPNATMAKRKSAWDALDESEKIRHVKHVACIDLTTITKHTDMKHTEFNPQCDRQPLLPFHHYTRNKQNHESMFPNIPTQSIVFGRMIGGLITFEFAIHE